MEDLIVPGSVVPGIWLDGRGDVHINVGELLAWIEVLDTPEMRDRLTAVLDHELGQLQLPNTRIVRH
jgi:hypothetical protein